MKKISGQASVTIVTVVYNAEDVIENTILSVLSQTYKNIEYIIIDGGSSDTTNDIIDKYASFISIHLIEMDLGIYDAMNKGILLARGDWINFLNAGDVFSSQFVIENIFRFNYPSKDVLYGDVQILYPSGKKYLVAKEISRVYKGMVFCHQSVFVKSSLHKNFYFNLSFKYSADFDFFIKLYQLGYKFHYLNFSISDISNGGVSDINRLQVIREWWLVLKHNKTRRYLLFYYFYLYIKSFFSLYINIILKLISSSIRGYLKTNIF